MLPVTIALTTLRMGHYLMFRIGIVSPVLWIIGAVIAPTAHAEGRHAAA